MQIILVYLNFFMDTKKDGCRRHAENRRGGSRHAQRRDFARLPGYVQGYAARGRLPGYPDDADAQARRHVRPSPEIHRPGLGVRRAGNLYGPGKLADADARRRRAARIL